MNELVNILQGNPGLIQTGLDEDTLAVAGGMRQTTKRISIKGGVFRKMANGKEIGAIEERFMNVIIVKMAHDASRSFYAKGYKEGEKISPVCWSNNSKTPDAEVPNPPAASCDACPHSVRGSGANGTGTGCRLSWRLAVVLPNDPSGDVMQLTLPATSAFGKEDNGRWPFRSYIQMLASHNVSAGRVITKMAFDTNAPTPKLLFSPASAVPTEDFETIQRQGKSPAAEAAVKLTVYQVDEGDAPAPAAVEEPVLRKSDKAPVEKADDVAGLVKKWGTKKEAA